MYNQEEGIKDEILKGLELKNKNTLFTDIVAILIL